MREETPTDSAPAPPDGKPKFLLGPRAAWLLHATGLLFEINRTILHPLGFALVVRLGDDVADCDLAGIQDCRYDPEGIAFTPEDYAAGAADLAAFMRAEGDARHEARQRGIGFVVQAEASPPGIRLDGEAPVAVAVAAEPPGARERILHWLRDAAMLLPVLEGGSSAACDSAVHTLRRLVGLLHVELAP